jgi:hypothetical protein
MENNVNKKIEIVIKPKEGCYMNFIFIIILLICLMFMFSIQIITFSLIFLLCNNCTKLGIKNSLLISLIGVILMNLIGII